MIYDISPKIREILETRKYPYEEAGAQELLEKSRIQFGTLEEVINHADILFIAVQTPHNPKYEGITRIPDERVDFDYSYLVKAVKDVSDIIEKQGKDKVVVIISTVLPGTIRREIKPLLGSHTKLCYNPYFIALTTVIQDFYNPEFVLFGVDDKEAAEKAKAFYQTIHDKRFYETSIENAEAIKVFYNTWISTKLAFVNVIMEISHKLGLDVDEITNALKLGSDRIISPRYMTAGLGDQGGCHPRDNIALSHLAKKLNLSYDWFEAAMMARERQADWFADLIVDAYERYKLPIVMLGYAYKPECSLTAGSQALLIKNILEEKGHKVELDDPYVNREKNGTALLGVGYREPAIYFIGTKHEIFKDAYFAPNSVVIDPWRYIPDQDGVKVIRIGG